MQGRIKLIKNDSKDIYNITKDFYFKSVLFFQTFYLSKNTGKKMYHCFHLTIQRNIYWASNQQMISEGPCGTED